MLSQSMLTCRTVHSAYSSGSSLSQGTLLHREFTVPLRVGLRLICHVLLQHLHQTELANASLTTRRRRAPPLPAGARRNGSARAPRRPASAAAGHWRRPAHRPPRAPVNPSPVLATVGG